MSQPLQNRQRLGGDANAFTDFLSAIRAKIFFSLLFSTLLIWVVAEGGWGVDAFMLFPIKLFVVGSLLSPLLACSLSLSVYSSRFPAL